MEPSGLPRITIGTIAAVLASCAPAQGDTTRTPESAATSEAAPAENPDELRVGNGRLHLSYTGERSPELQTRARRLVERSARAVMSYYGQFPVDEARVEIRFTSGGGMGGGHVVVTDLPTIRLGIGRDTAPIRFERDWRMTHEMVHLAFPSVNRSHHWIEEGIATYVEPIARARVDWVTEHHVFEEWVTQMHQGQPGPGDQGLDRTPTWARTYWGGALFCLAADVEIRRRTQNRFGLRDALVAINRGGGRIDRRWPLRRALQMGDRATGVPVLEELYDELRDRPEPVDLEGIWRTLGIQHASGEVVLDPSEDKTELRRALLFSG